MNLISVQRRRCFGIQQPQISNDGATFKSKVRLALCRKARATWLNLSISAWNAINIHGLTSVACSCLNFPSGNTLQGPKCFQCLAYNRLSHPPSLHPYGASAWNTLPTQFIRLNSSVSTEFPWRLSYLLYEICPYHPGWLQYSIFHSTTAPSSIIAIIFNCNHVFVSPRSLYDSWK